MGFAYPIDSKVVTNPNGTIDYDRASSSTQLRGLIKSMITNGVNLTESTNLQVMADEETMNLVVKPGYVIIEGALKHFEDDAKVTIGVADTNNPRIDTVVARLNLNEDVRDIVIDVLQGTPSAEPTAPELTRTTSYYEVGLADILVEVGTSQISQAVVTDTRLLNSRCGMISAIGEIDTETLFNQLTTDFDNWFESIKGKLGDDVAGGLQMQINDLADDIDTLQEEMADISPRVETLEVRPTTLLCANSELYIKEVECDIALPTVLSLEYSNYRRVWDMLYYNGELYILMFDTSASTLNLCVYDGVNWTQVNIDNGSTVREGGNLQELNGVIYIAYAKYQASMRICKYENGAIVEVGKQGLGSADGRCYLAKDFDNNVLYFVTTKAYSSSNYACNYQSFDGVTFGENIRWYYGSSAILSSAYIRNGKLYILSQTSDGMKLFELDLVSNSSSLRYTLKKYEGSNFGITKNICGKYLSTPYNIVSGQYFIYQNASTTGLTDVFCGGIGFTEYDNGMYICDMKNNPDTTGLYKSLKKIKLYRKLHTYGKQGDVLQCGDSFAISDNLEVIDNGYRVTTDGNVEIGIYL